MRIVLIIILTLLFQGCAGVVVVETSGLDPQIAATVHGILGATCGDGVVAERRDVHVETWKWYDPRYERSISGESPYRVRSNTRQEIRCR